MPYRRRTVDGGPPVRFQQWARTDEAYRNAINNLQTNYLAYKGENTKNQGNLTADFDLTKERMGLDKDEATRRQNEDFAARGMFGSGLYRKANTDLGNKYLQQSADAQTSYDRNAGQLINDLSNAQTMLRQQKADARLAAMRRYAEKFGIR